MNDTPDFPGRIAFEDGDVIYTIPEDKDDFIEDYRTDAIVNIIVDETLSRWPDASTRSTHPLAVSGLWAEFRGEQIGGPQEWFGFLEVNDQ